MRGEVFQITVNLRIGERNPTNYTSDKIVTVRKLEQPSSFR
jgi:hypothetical protein